MLRKHFVALRIHFASLRKHFVTLHMRFVSLRSHFVTLRMGFVPLRTYFVTLLIHFVRLLMHFVPLRKDFVTLHCCNGVAQLQFTGHFLSYIESISVRVGSLPSPKSYQVFLKISELKVKIQKRSYKNKKQGAVKEHVVKFPDFG
jgi:hypothetical protein